MTSNINMARSLGKGEVVSSILTGSTTKYRGIGAIRDFLKAKSATRYATKREHDISIRGKSVDYVHGAFRA